MMELLGEEVQLSMKPEKGHEGLSLKPKGSAFEGYESFTCFPGNSFSLWMAKCTKIASLFLWLDKDRSWNLQLRILLPSLESKMSLLTTSQGLVDFLNIGSQIQF